VVPAAFPTGDGTMAACAVAPLSAACRDAAAVDGVRSGVFRFLYERGRVHVRLETVIGQQERQVTELRLVVAATDVPGAVRVFR
jgi:hypothetical protein